MTFKAPGLGFLVVPGTFQALGHLILGPQNTFPGKGNKKSKKLHIWKCMGQDASGICEICQTLPFRVNS